MIHERDLRAHPGIKRPYLKLPDTLEGTQCYCVTIPDGLTNKLVLLDLLGMAIQWFNWERTAGMEAKQAADAWRDALQLPEGLKMCCCPEPTNQRYNEEGILEVSYDGGITWTPAPEQDDRFSGIIAPPIPGADGNDKKCAAAASAQEFVKLNLIDELETGQAYASIFDTIIGIILALGVTGIAILAAAITAAIFTAGVVAVQAAFTTEVWADFRCILYCRIRSDGSFSETGWSLVKGDILDQFTGIVSAVLYNWVNTVGPVGLTNAARSGFVVSADCSSCDECPATCEIDTSLVTFGTVIDYSETTIKIEVEFDASRGIWLIGYGQRPPDGMCCFLCGFGVISGVVQGTGWRDCDDGAHIDDPSGHELSLVEISATGAGAVFELRFATIETPCP